MVPRLNVSDAKFGWLDSALDQPLRGSKHRTGKLAKDISVTAPLATGLVPFDLEGARPNAEEEPEDEDKGLIPGHGEIPLTTDATATLLATIDAELTSRGIDIAKLA